MKRTEMRFRSSFLLGIAAVIVMAVMCGAAAKPEALAAGNGLSKDDDAAIRKIPLGFEAAWNTHDMKAISDLFREDAEFINVVGMHWHGREAIVKAHAVYHELMFKDCRLTTDSIETRALGADHAVAVWTATQDSFTTPSGNVMPKTQTKLSFILRKGPEGWKIAHGQNVRIDAEAAKHDPVNAPKK